MKNLKEIAAEIGLQVITTTSDLSGFPRNERIGVIGFDSYNQAESFAEKHDLDVVLFWKRNGWQCYCVSPANKNDACVYYRKEYKSDSSDYSIYDKRDISYFQERLEEALADGEKENSILVTHPREMIEALEKLESGQVLVYDGCNGGYTIEQEYAVSWSYDDRHYIIGVM